MSKQQKVTIAGAGLVGSLCAVYMARRGYQVDVYEQRADIRDPAAVVGGRSINLALAERGMHALRGAGLMDKVEPELIPMRGRMIHEVDGATHLQPYSQFDHEFIYSVSRTELNRILINAAEAHDNVTLHFNCGVRDVDVNAKTMRVGGVEASEQREVGFDVLIGADGAGSNVRRGVQAVESQQMRVDWLDHGYKELCIPPSAEGGFLIEKEALHIWPRSAYMLIALPNLDGSFTVTLFFPMEGEPSFASLSDEASVQRFFEAHFADALALMPDLAKQFFDNPTGKLGTVRTAPWCSGSTLLVGDAAHAIVPFHGQGMNAGFEDCAVLDAVLNEAGDDWQKAMNAFNGHKDNGDAIADMAIENYLIMRDSVRDEKFLLKKQIGFKLERLYPERFIPRYSMVMFRRIPYSEVIKRGLIQEEILSELAANISDVAQLDEAKAKTLMDEKLA